MEFRRPHLARLALAAAACGWASAAGAQPGPVNYELTRPAWAPPSLRLGTNATGPQGAGLSLEAGKDWFGRLGLGHAPDTGTQWSLGAGYRWGNGESLALEMTRARGQAQLGLALRYDWPRYYLRLSYDPKPGELPADVLRFSAGIRF